MTNIVQPYFSDEERGKETKRPHNRHHKICRSRGGNNHDDNIGRIYVEVHDAIHRLFGNLLPHEQITRLVDLNGSVHTEEFKRDLHNILSVDDPDYYYERGLWREK